MSRGNNCHIFASFPISHTVRSCLHNLLMQFSFFICFSFPVSIASLSFLAWGKSARLPATVNPPPKHLNYAGNSAANNRNSHALNTGLLWQACLCLQMLCLFNKEFKTICCCVITVCILSERGEGPCWVQQQYLCNPIIAVHLRLHSLERKQDLTLHSA